MRDLGEFEAMAKEAVDWRRTLHRYPETCYEEKYASDFVAKKLEGMGIEVHRGLAGTGVVGVIEGKGGGNRAVGLRADIDGLDIEEENDGEWKSLHEGKMHGCGHDGHMAMLLCAARYLSWSRNFSGRCYVIFQPAEEGGAGAARMMEEGLFERFPMESVWGMHCYPGERVGWIGVRSGVFFASADRFEVRVRGEGGHAACPHQTRDPVVIASHVLLALQTVVSRFVDPLENVVVSVCEMRGGSANNIIPDEVVLSGTVRTFSEEVLSWVKECMERQVKAIAEAYGGSAEWIYERKYPVLVNRDAETKIAEEVACDWLGEENVGLAKKTMGGEDFAFMLEEVPGSYILVGNGERGEKGGEPVHSPRFDFNDEALKVGAGYWISLVERLLGREEG